jgi:Aminomethyltransferase folate-binding domain
LTLWTGLIVDTIPDLFRCHPPFPERREAGKHQACAYGTEAMHVLRAEKGFIIVGQETDGTVTSDDAGLTWASSPFPTT